MLLKQPTKLSLTNKLCLAFAPFHSFSELTKQQYSLHKATTTDAVKFILYSKSIKQQQGSITSNTCLYHCILSI